MKNPFQKYIAQAAPPIEAAPTQKEATKALNEVQNVSKSF
jgi:hypothetical protein